jgi:branched-chain amino acid transport system substrate-binding protein
MNKRIWIVGGLLILVVGLMLTVHYERSKKQNPNSYKIGAIVFLTGPQAPLGQEVRNALQIAAEELNEKGGIAHNQIEILFEDSKDTPRDAIMAFHRLASKNVPVIITTGDVVSLNLAPVVGEKRIPMVATVAAGPDITKRSNYVFRVFLQTAPPAELIAQFAYQKLSLRSAALLSINNEFGLASDAAFKNKFEELGGKVLAVEHYRIDDRDVRAQIAKLKATEPEAIFVGGFGEGYGACIKQVREMRFSGLLLTTSSLSIPYFQKQTWPASEGAYFTSTVYDEYDDAPAAANFTNRYRTKFGSNPSYIGAFAYDSLKLIAIAIEKGGYTSEGIRAALLGINDYNGVVGPMAFDNRGELDFPLVVKQIQNGRPVVVLGP